MHAAVVKVVWLGEGAELVTVLRLSHPRHRTSRFSEDVVYASKMASDRGMECCISLPLCLYSGVLTPFLFSINCLVQVNIR